MNVQWTCSGCKQTIPVSESRITIELFRVRNDSEKVKLRLYCATCASVSPVPAHPVSHFDTPLMQKLYAYQRVDPETQAIRQKLTSNWKAATR
jgi:hypothetical protein